MAKKTERVAIDGVQYEITQLGAEAGRGLSKKFLTAIGPLLREVVSGDAVNELQSAIGSATGDSSTEAAAALAEKGAVKALQLIVPLLLRAIETLPTDLFEELCEAFAECCLVTVGKTSGGDGIPFPLQEVFDQHFAGEYQAMYQWLGHCIRVNGFLGKGLRGLGAAKAARAA